MRADTRNIEGRRMLGIESERWPLRKYQWPVLHLFWGMGDTARLAVSRNCSVENQKSARYSLELLLLSGISPDVQNGDTGAAPAWRVATVQKSHSNC
jgi:hypothetical protein